jgi:carbonic anhydrase
MKDHLLEKARPFFQQYGDENKPLLKRLFQEGQAPQVLFITCADSRIMPEKMLGLNPGEYFVVRNVANIVPPYHYREPSVTAALEFALFSLPVTEIVVCGHSDCGGLRALAEGIEDERFSALPHWLNYSHSSAKQPEDVRQNLSERQKHLAVVEAHVIQQLANLRTYPFVQNAINDRKLTLHGWVHDLERSTIRFNDGAMGPFSEFAIS